MAFFRRNYTKSSDEELFHVLKGDRNAAFEELYQRYHRKMHFFFWQMLNGDEEKAQDFLHDLFVKIIEKPQLFDPKKRFSTWIYTVATNMCRNEFRNNKVRNVVGNGYDLSRVADLNDNPAEVLDRKIFRESLTSELEVLNPDHKTAFILRFHEEMSIKEIAAVMECSEGTVKSRLFYTLKKLGKKLEAHQH